MDAPRLVSDAHAVMAIGALGADVHKYVNEREKDPEPPEWLDLWYSAVEQTRGMALAELRAKIGAEPPSHDQALEVETLAQGHYEAYCRLNADRVPEPIAWEALPDDRRALMCATIADMLASGLLLVGPQAAHPKGSRELWVVTTNRPGPGPQALIREALVGTDDHTPLGGVLGDIMTAATRGAEFVETEDAAGHCHREDRGIDWERHPTSEGLWRLGPFPAPPSTLTPSEAAAVYLWAVGDGARVPPGDPGEFDLTGKGLVKLVETARAGGLLEGEPIDLGEAEVAGT